MKKHYVTILHLVVFINVFCCLTGTTTTTSAFIIRNGATTSCSRHLTRTTSDDVQQPSAQTIRTTTTTIISSRTTWLNNNRLFATVSSPGSTTGTTEEEESSSTSSSSTSDDSSSYSYTSISDKVLQSIANNRDESCEYAEMFGLSNPENAAFYSLFTAIRNTTPEVRLLGLKGSPFLLRHDEICNAFKSKSNHNNDNNEETATATTGTTGWPGFFTMTDLEKAVTDDFLDAARGSTTATRSKGWQITGVSQPRGDSFEEARMTYDDVQAALEKGTVIFNAAGAHICKLAGPSLACTDATNLPCALNLYVTAKDKRTSAPPHTDKQDVAVVQTSGRKHWRVYSPPNPALKPPADIFARGKHDDSMPLHALQDMGCELLIETTLNPGDTLFVPAGFPHTTDTVHDDDNPHSQETSVHLTLGIDHHIWELDYLNARRLALRRAHVKDTALGQMSDDANPFVGKVNELPLPVWKDLLAELPLGLLEEDETIAAPYIDEATSELERISTAVDPQTASLVDPSVWREAILRFRQEGMELFETHRDMYLAAIEEGQRREAEEAMTAHLSTTRRTMTPERIQRLSLFRVKKYFDSINDSKAALKQWSYQGTPPPSSRGEESTGAAALPEDWQYTLPVQVGDEVEADLGGAFFPAKIARVGPGETLDVQFFDGDSETGLDRSMIKLLTPPPIAASAGDDEVDTSNMTPKQLKRYKKQQEKLKKKKMNK